MSCCQELSDGIARLPNVPRRISAASRFGRYGRSSASYVRGKLTKARSASARPSSVVLAHRGAGFPVHDAPRIAGSTEIKKRTLHGERFIIKIHPRSGWYFIFGQSPKRYWQRTSASFIGLPAMQLLLITHKWVLRVKKR